MANTIRRYQPRRSSGSAPWARIVIGLILLVVVFMAARALFGGTNDTANENTNDNAITLVNDSANTNTASTDTPATNENTNSAPAEPELTTVPEDVCKEPISKYGDGKVAVLTFEMSAANENATNLIAQLKKEKVPASFFATGTFAEKNPDLLKSIVTAGYSVYNRGYDSTNLTTLTAETIPVQLTKAAVALEAATGLSPTPYLRPAFNATNETVVTAATEAGYCIILGTVDATDWQDGVTAEAAIDRVMGKLTPGMIIQLHAGYDITALTVTGLVAELKAKGYSLVSLPSLINS